MSRQKSTALTSAEAQRVAASVEQANVKSQELVASQANQCDNCICYIWDRDGKIGRCHHNPPAALGSSASFSNSAWPPVEPNGWCYQHKRKEN